MHDGGEKKINLAIHVRAEEGFFCTYLTRFSRDGNFF